MRSVPLILLATLSVICSRQLTNVNNGVGDFSIRLLQATFEENKNSLHSAYSIAFALGMCLVGAQGSTFISMRDAMGLSGMTEDDIKSGFKESTDQLAQLVPSPGHDFVISKANRVYVAKSYMIGTNYNQTLSHLFRSNSQLVDFKGNAAEVQKDINNFIKDATYGVIPMMLTKPVDTATIMTVINALYFKGSWRKVMNTLTSTEKFNAYICPYQVAMKPADAGQAVNWIQKKDSFAYQNSSELEATLVELPYYPNRKSSNSASMVIILPHPQHRCNISAWVKRQLNWISIVKTMGVMETRSVNITFPRIDIEADFQLSDKLQSLGMTEAFSNRANFSGMVDSGSADLRINSVIHKAKMQVDENGATAAAASIVTVGRSAGIKPVPTEEVFVNRSFVALIVLRQFGSIVPLFTSVVNQP
ncbi:serpin B10-like [Tropilaelaps mercedesae]|uniref:Serpin B10-like n=1 Tax=Tropilaelaps mercedesae TaxID=418985 RepID=A0A1V9XUD8_9ACAR|nr:serpin B10-like [Tropilaelaps mercedesae]